jgi:hypothetical protein
MGSPVKLGPLNMTAAMANAASFKSVHVDRECMRFLLAPA